MKRIIKSRLVSSMHSVNGAETFISARKLQSRLVAQILFIAAVGSFELEARICKLY